MNTPFHQDLAISVRENNILGANRVIMGELGNVIVNHRQDFIDLLVNSDAPAYAELADRELIDMYFENLNNKDLIIGTALLVNIHNKTMNADGQSEISDTGVKAAYKVMTSCFSGQVGPITPQEIAEHRRDWQYSNVIGVGAIRKGIKAARFLKNARANKESAKDNLKDSVAQQKQQQAIIAQAKKDRNKMIAMVVGSGIVVATIVGLLIYKLKK